MNYSDGSKYVGEWKNKERVGQGSFTFPNGRMVGEWKENSLYDGLITIWYKNKKKQLEGIFKDGKENGLFTEWYENGQIKSETNYKNGMKHGLMTGWKNNGEKELIMNYKNGKEDGFLITEWYETGQKKSETNYKNGKKNGLFTGWHKNGMKNIEGYFKDGEILQNTFTTWDENGEKTSGMIQKETIVEDTRPITTKEQEDVKEQLATIINLNGLLCAKVLDVKHIEDLPNVYEVNCIEYGGRSETKNYILDVVKGIAVISE